MTLDNERVQFYLRHRDQLEEWFALRSEAAAAIEEWLAGLSVDVGSLVAELGADVEFVPSVEDAAYPSLFLKRSTWPGKTATDAVALIGLQWVKGKTLLGPSSAPYAGLRCDRTTPIGRELREDPQFQEKRRLRKDRNTPWWPAFGYIFPETPFPERADEYRRALINEVREVWNAYASAVDRAAGKLISPT